MSNLCEQQASNLPSMFAMGAVIWKSFFFFAIFPPKMAAFQYPEWFSIYLRLKKTVSNVLEFLKYGIAGGNYNGPSSQHCA